MPEPVPADIPEEPDTCRVVEVPDVGPVRVRGSGEWTDEDHAAFAELVQAARRRYIAERGEPDE